MKNMVLVRIITALALLAVSGCGYTFQGSGSVLPPDVKRIYIPLVENATPQSGLAPMMTEALRDKFERFGVVEVLDQIGGADAVLKAKILKITRDTSAVTSNTDTSLKQDVTMTISVELRRVTGPLLWKEAALAVTRSYANQAGAVVVGSSDFVSGTIGAADLNTLSENGSREVARGQENQAFTYLTDRAAQIVYDSAVSPDF